jgi:mRNA interferase MazF
MNAMQREIFLVPFPFSDFSERKVRPVVVVSNNGFNNYSEDIIVCAITSNVSKDHIKINNEDLEEGKLFTTSSVKIENILNISKNLLIKKIGKINKKKYNQIQTKLNLLFND